MPCIPLAIANVTNPVWYGLCLAVPPLFATGVAMYGQKGLMLPGPDAPWSELSSNLGFLLGGSLLAQVLSYAPFLGAQVLAKPNQRSLVADFIVGLFLSRLPILLFQAVQAALLPKLSTLVSAGRDDEFQNGVRKLVMIVVGIGVLGVIAGGSVGPFAGRILFGHKFNLGHADVALLAAGSGLFILALTLSQALIALSGHRQAMTAWFAGIRCARRHDRGRHPRAVPAGRARLDRRRRGERGRDGLVLRQPGRSGACRPGAWRHSSSRSNTARSRSKPGADPDGFRPRTGRSSRPRSAASRRAGHESHTGVVLLARAVDPADVRPCRRGGTGTSGP